MEFLNSWLQGIIIAVIISTIIEMLLPNGNSKKYIKVILGVYLVFNIITPVVNKFFKSDFELSSIFNIEEYMKKIDTYDVSSKNIDMNKSNEDSIKQIYISNLKKDMKSKLEERGFWVKQIQVDIENNQSYLINNISLSLEKKEDENVKEKSIDNRVVINEIEKVEIQVGDKKDVELKEKSNITEKEIKEIKQYLISVYEVKEKQINIY